MLINLKLCIDNQAETMVEAVFELLNIIKYNLLSPFVGQSFGSSVITS